MPKGPLLKSRDLLAVERATAAHLTRLRAERGPAAIVEMAEALLDHARAAQRAWPTVDDRRRDLAAHRALIRLLDRAPDLRDVGGSPDT